MKIELENISKVIKNKVILQDINMKLESGHIYAFVGTNGSGKTMLMRMLTGLVAISSGCIKVNDKEINMSKGHPFEMGVIIEKPEFFNEMSAYENLLVLAKLRNKIGSEEIRNAINKVGLDANSIQRVKEYSLGMKQRLGIAQAIMEDPDVLILDEPTGALDEEGIQLIYHILREEKERGKVIIISSHYKEDIKELSDKIYHFKNQRVSEGD